MLRIFLVFILNSFNSKFKCFQILNLIFLFRLLTNLMNKIPTQGDLISLFFLPLYAVVVAASSKMAVENSITLESKVILHNYHILFLSIKFHSLNLSYLGNINHNFNYKYQLRLNKYLIVYFFENFYLKRLTLSLIFHVFGVRLFLIVFESKNNKKVQKNKYLCLIVLYGVIKQ